MKEKISTGKLGTQHAHGKLAKTCTPEKEVAPAVAVAPNSKIKLKLKFTDYAIEKFISSFGVPPKKRVFNPLDVSRQSVLKGLRICQYFNGKKKYFVLNYWYNGKMLHLTIGQFIPGIFGVKQCQDKLHDLVKEHCNDKGRWIKDPKQTIRDQENKESKAIIVESYKLPVNEVIIRLCKANFPKAKREGRLTASSIKMKCKDLIGWNWRARHLIYVDDRRGHGQVHFKSNYHKRTAKPSDWDDLFKKFPPGHGVIKDKKFNPNNERSVFDSDLGTKTIDELTTGLVKRYINSKDRSFGKKINMLDSFKTLWAFAKDKDLFGDVVPKDPTKEIVFKTPDIKRSPGTIYNDRRFEEHELQKIYQWLVKNAARYPFQAEALLFMLCTGRRAEETMKIRKSMISEDRTLITLPANITKARKTEYVDITPPVAFVLNQLKKHTEGKHKPYQFLDWLFPTIRIDQKKLHDDYYVRSDQCRIKKVRGCWSALAKETGIQGAPKMLRKTFSSIAKIELGTTSKARALTGHEQDATLDIHYDKTSRSKAKEYAHQVAKVFNFDKAGNE